MNNDSTYNGWTNYETWRVGLEIVTDDEYLRERATEISEKITSDQIKADKEKYYVEYNYAIMELKQNIIDFVQEIVFSPVETARQNIGMNRDYLHIEGYADSFLRNVNYWELAEHLIIDAINNREWEQQNG